MTISEDARVSLLIADYIGVDASAKMNVIGAGVSVTGLLPTGLTAPQTVAVVVAAPSRYAGQDAAISLELRDADTGQAVQLPGVTGRVEALRVQQLVRFDVVSLPGVALPSSLPVQVQMVMAFSNGLPLLADHVYQWRVDVDGRHRKGWVADFFVAGPPRGPVFGGPVSTDPADLPSTLLDDPLEGAERSA